MAKRAKECRIFQLKFIHLFIIKIVPEVQDR